MEEKIMKNEQHAEVDLKFENRIILKWQEKTGEKECTYLIRDSDFPDHQKLDSVMEEEEEERSESSAEMKMKKKKALLEFRCMMEDAILGNYLLPNPKKLELSRKEKKMAREISLWGVPLLPSKGHEGTDTILLKFLRANNFKAQEAFEMLRNTLKWRQEYNADAILEEDLQLGFENIMQVNSFDKEGHPLHYHAFGVFKEELYSKLFGTEESREKFLRWKIQSVEKAIKQLSFKEGSADSILQITDFKNSPGPERKELRSVTRRALTMLQTNYPDIIHKDIMINVPFWFYTSHYVISKFISPKNKRKFILVRPSKVTKTLLKHISPEHLATEYGGLRKENDVDFSPDDKASELRIRPSSSEQITFPVNQSGVTIVWNYGVVGWDVTCKEEFVPDDECSYRILIRKEKDKKVGESARNSFYINEPGKIVITIHNATLKKKTAYYRSKAKPTVVLFNK